MRLQSGALPGEGRLPHGGDGLDVLTQGGGGVAVGAQLLGLGVDAVAALLAGRGRLRAPGGDVGGDLVPFVRECVREGERLLGLLGERDQALGVVQLFRGGEDRGQAEPARAGGHDGHGDDEPVAYVRLPPGADGGGPCLCRPLLVRGGRGGLRSCLLACAPRPRLLHRCSHS